MVRFIKDSRGRKRYAQITYREYRNIQTELTERRIANMIMMDELRKMRSGQLPDHLDLLKSQAN